MKPEIAFVGAGKMVTAIVEGLLRNKIFEPVQMACVSAPDGTSEKLSATTGIRRAASIEELLADGAGRVLLGCKPQQFVGIEEEVASRVEGGMVLSIMAGINLERLRDKFAKAGHVVRSMPNTPGQIGAGVTAYAFADEAGEEERADVERILGALGRVFHVEEWQIDAVTAISGSGPAYVFEFACALEDAAGKIGLDPEFSRTLAVETILGAGRLMARSEESPETLRNYVTSPNGTTQAALERFTEADFRSIVERAVLAARDRSIELSRPDA